METVLQLSGITVEFPGVRALDNVDLQLGRGEVLGLVGENGAGKSTLIKVLGGVHPAGSFAGTITLGGARRRFRSPADGLRAGVAIVHQELSLIPFLTVAENLVLGDEPARAGILDTVGGIARARGMLEQVLGDDADQFDLDAPASSLGVGRQQILEITRAMSSGAPVIILDEPTAALTATETERLFELVRSAAGGGTSFIFISHHLSEVLELCDRVLVLRDGKAVAEGPASDIDTDWVVAHMTGDADGDAGNLARGGGSAGASGRRRPERNLGDTVLRVEHLSLTQPDPPRRQVVSDVSLHVRSGEVVALAGAMGAGRSALLSTLYGDARGRVSGRVVLDGEPVDLSCPRRALAQHIAFVPEDRKHHGFIPDMSVTDNMRLSSLDRALVHPAQSEHIAAREVERLRVKAAGTGVAVQTLSGGNQQKVVLGRCLLTRPRLLLLDEPTRGVDVGARAEIYALIDDMVSQGLAVLMASSDLHEILTFAHRVIVLRDGRVAGELSAEYASEQAIMTLAVGGTAAAPQPTSRTEWMN